MTKIYTRAGDSGVTSLWGKTGEKRVSKEDARVEAYGTIDEANAVIGLARATLSQPGPWAEHLGWVQHRLFALGADLSNTDVHRRPRITAEDVTVLEKWIDEIQVGLPPLTGFILPGGPPAAAVLQQARTVVRRAERRLVRFLKNHPDPTLEDALCFVNRLSDWLFMAARAVALQSGAPDELAQF